MNQEIIWINGNVTPMADAKLSVEDRGFQFADGVYEVVRLYDGQPFTMTEHLQRLQKSAAGIEIELPMTVGELAEHVLTFLPQTGVRDGMVYMQLTRGVAPRNHLYPAHIQPTLLFYTRTLPSVPELGTAAGVKLMSAADERWKRCWIKSIALLPNVLAKNKAAAAGFDEAAFIEDDVVTECSASNLFAVIGGALVTHPVGPKVLPGITRHVLLQIAASLDIEVQEQPLTVTEALRADELFITSTTRELSWVSQWDQQPVGLGRCGNVTLRLHRAYQERVRSETMVATVQLTGYELGASARNAAAQSR
ncbi:MAG TPA: D-amino-acid transaminase [Tepidisphaeraceae bacterium]|jgi:D-alanine transaminase|nr:D-amino-acid transaminase [Tepidisphaeraceae bacterium]